MKTTAENLRKLAEDIRNTTQYLSTQSSKTASADVDSKELDTKHVLNFLKFFAE